MGLGICPSAGASPLLEYADLAHAQLKPAPLVPTTAPKALRPLSRTLAQAAPAGGNRYTVRLLAFGSGGRDAIIALERGRAKSVAVAVKRARRNAFRIRSTRVRGHAAKLLTRGHGTQANITLVWKEKGAVYELATGTTRTISLKNLRSFANGLQALEREYVGTIFSNDLSQGGTAVTTTGTASVLVEWEASCGYAGSEEFSLLPRSGNTFTFGLTASASQPWTLTGSGTISPDEITLNVRATGTLGGQPCDTGPLVLHLNQRFSD